MKKAVIFLASVLAGFVINAAHAQNDAAAIDSAQAVIPQRGALYRIHHQHHTSYLFGTIHVGLPTFFPLEPQVTQALRLSPRLVLEVDTRDRQLFQAALQKYGRYADGSTIDRHLSGDSLMRLQQALGKYDVPFERVKYVKPWALANILLSLELARNDYHYGHGVEQFLLSHTAQSKTIQALESADYQMSLFDAMGDARQEQYLRELLVELEDGSAFRRAQAIIDAWANADSNAIEELLRASRQESSVSSEFTQRVLLGRRNPEMADKIEALLQADAGAFIGVGLLHLAGENDIPALLRRRGYAVEKLY